MSRFRVEAIGQLLLVELEEDRWSRSLEKLLRAWRPGGVLLPARSLRTPESSAELLSKITATLPSPPLLALEEEGGTVDPLRAFFPSLPSPQATAKKGVAAAARLGELIGAALSLLGFNANLGPLLDLAHPSGKSSFGTRSFSANPRVVAQCGGAFIRGLERHRILPCAKYFPGLSTADLDRHSKLPLVGKTMVELWRQDLVPYRQLLPHLPLLMIGHAAFKAYDFDTDVPATQSARVVEGLLHVKLNYRGVAVADDLAAEALRQMHNPAEAAIKSLNAGCDLLRVKGDGRVVESVLSSMKEGIELGRISPDRLEEAVDRMHRVRGGLGRPREKISPRAFEQLAREFEKFGRECQLQEERIA